MDGTSVLNLKSGTVRLGIKAILITAILSGFVLLVIQGPINLPKHKYIHIINKDSNHLRGYKLRKNFSSDDETKFRFGIDCNDVINGKYNIEKASWDLNYKMSSSHDVTEGRMVRPAYNCLEQDDPHVVDHINNNVILDWDRRRPMKLGNKVDQDAKSLFDENSQAMDIWKMIFKDKLRDGFFIEAGAVDCEWQSVTLPFEIRLNWTGLLVELSQEFFPLCRAANRRAKLAQTCLAVKPHMHFAHFDEHSVGEVKTKKAVKEFALMPGLIENNLTATTIEAQCHPIYPMLLAMGNPTVNLFVLDVEGAEGPILQTIPWDKVDIEVLSVETNLAGTIYPGSREGIVEMMDKNGYDVFQHSNDFRKEKKFHAI